MKGVAFFFSSVTALERRSKGKKKNNEQQEDEQNDEVQEKYWPAITYWIAVQSPNGTRVSTVPLHSALLQTGMEVPKPYQSANEDVKRNPAHHYASP